MEFMIQEREFTQGDPRAQNNLRQESKNGLIPDPTLPPKNAALRRSQWNLSHPTRTH